MNFVDIDINDLLQEITSTTSTLETEQNELEQKLLLYSQSKELSQQAIDNWINLKVPTTQNESIEKKTMTPQQQYNQPTSWILMKRVIQGKDWHYGRTDKKEVKGVVYSVSKEGNISVKWDDGDKTHCRWGKDNCYDVLVVNDELDNSPVPPSEQVKKPLSWVIGKTVKRGRDWKWQDQDGGIQKTGLVLSSAGKGWINVRWENGKVNQYRWGDDDCYDLEVIF